MAIITDCLMKFYHEEGAPSGWLGRARARLGLWRCRARTRCELAALDERTLQDIGLNPARVRAEAAKPFWRPLSLRPQKDRRAGAIR